MLIHVLLKTISNFTKVENPSHSGTTDILGSMQSLGRQGSVSSSRRRSWKLVEMTLLEKIYSSSSAFKTVFPNTSLPFAMFAFLYGGARSFDIWGRVALHRGSVCASHPASTGFKTRRGLFLSPRYSSCCDISLVTA